MPFVESEYPQEVNERVQTVKTGSPNSFKIEPQPTRLVRGLELGNSRENTVVASIKEIGVQFSRKQDEIVQELQRKKSED